MIIAFVGKAGSGKSTACGILKAKGYTELNFADPLKKMVSQLLELPLAECYSQEDKERPRDFLVTKEQFKKLLVDNGFNTIPNSIARHDAFIFESLRQVLQFVGSDLFREADSSFWINQFKNLIKLGHSYVVGDCRFENEAAAIKELGGYTIKINRPSTNNSIDTHVSEQLNFTTDFTLSNTDLELFKRDLLAVEGIISSGTIKGQE